MDTNGHEYKDLSSASPKDARSRVQHEWFSDSLLHGDLVYSIVGAALEVLKALGHGLHEKPYENALIRELLLRSHEVHQQCHFEIKYKGHVVGEFVPDLIVGDRVIVDTKTIENIGNHERGQMLNYLRISRLRVGLIINFRRARLEWERVVL
jgi:GxxExxY protein